MKQALHIFRKDVRHLRLEICMGLALATGFAWLETHSSSLWWSETLLIVWSAYVIARLIHAEALIGTCQFWVTRPYRWKSLLGAKLLFILVFVNLPILAARLVILGTAGFPIASALPGLLWSQLLLFTGAMLPIAALAAMTGGIVPFTFSVLVLLTIGFGMQEIMVPPYLPSIRLLLGPVQWVWDSNAILALVAIAIPVLYVQYKSRHTLFSRTFACGVALVGAVAYLYLPWSLAIAVQTGISQPGFDTSSLQIKLDLAAKGFLGIGNRGPLRLDLPLAVAGVPKNVDVAADALTVSFQGPDGKTWKTGPYQFQGVPRNLVRAGDNVFDGIVVMDQTFFNQERDQEVALRGSLFLTLFGNPQLTAIPLQAAPVIATGGLRCALGFLNQLFCMSALRWPDRLVYAQFQETDKRYFSRSISYSPFPAGLGFDSIEVYGVSTPPSARQATIVAEQPMGHFRRDFEIRGVRLAELVAITK
jgi:hypothetical protein